MKNNVNWEGYMKYNLMKNNRYSNNYVIEYEKVLVLIELNQRERGWVLRKW